MTAVFRRESCGMGFRIYGYQTMDYDPFNKGQSCLTQSTLVPYVVRVWSRYPLNLSGNETFAVRLVED